MGPAPIVCKFRCDQVTLSKHWDKSKGMIYSATFSPVTGGSEENAAFWAATPSGKLEVGCVTNRDFEPGKEYFVEIRPA